MFVGDVGRFAIEFEFDEAQEDSLRWRFGFGHVRFWFGDTPVGCFETRSSLGSLAVGFRSILACRPLRRAPAHLCALPTQQLFDELNAVVYGVDLEFIPDEDLREKVYSAYFVNPGMDTFDDWKIVAIECDNVQRLLWRPRNSRAQEVLLRCGEFEEVSSLFIAAVERWSSLRAP
jgi:hypothetical protein